VSKAEQAVDLVARSHLLLIDDGRGLLIPKGILMEVRRPYGEMDECEGQLWCNSPSKVVAPARTVKLTAEDGGDDEVW